MKTPVIFIHGLWLHGDSWKPWVDLFQEAGYEASALGWPGDSSTVEETRAHPERMGTVGIGEIVDHYAQMFASLTEKPIVIGHSFGGLIAQRLLAQGAARAVVAIDAAPSKGIVYLPPSALRVASVALMNPLNWSRAVSLTPAQFRYGFANTLTDAESEELFRWTIPSPGRPLFQAALANFVPNSSAMVDTKTSDRGPLLLIAGCSDNTVPAVITRATKKLYARSKAVTDIKEFPDRDHSLALNSRWREVADFSLAWLKEHGA